MNFLNIFKREPLLQQSLEEINLMFEKNKDIFQKISNYVFSQKETNIDIKKEDRKLNIFEMQIRKKIFEHLMINPQKDLTYSLIIIDVARDVERVGDYSKDLYNTTKDLEPLERDNEFWKELQKISNYISQLMEDIHLAFESTDEESAKRSIKDYRKDVYQKIDDLTLKIAQNNKLPNDQAITLVLSARFLKRITGHLINIATSVVNEFPKMRYTNNVKDV